MTEEDKFSTLSCMNYRTQEEIEKHQERLRAMETLMDSLSVELSFLIQKNKNLVKEIVYQKLLDTIEELDESLDIEGIIKSK